MPSEITQAINILNEKSLADQGLITDIVTEIVNFDLLVEARQLFKKTVEVLGEPGSIGQLEYQYLKPLLVQCQLVALPLLSVQEVDEFLKKHLTFGLVSKDNPLKNQISAWLKRVLVYDERDMYKKRFQQTLENNQTVLIEKKFITVANQQIPATIANWLRDYRIFIGQPKTTTLASMEYLFKNSNLISLSESDKELIKQLIVLYEYLLTPFSSVKGFDEPIPVDDEEGPGIYQQGIFTKIDEKPYKEKIGHYTQLIQQVSAAKKISPSQTEALIKRYHQLLVGLLDERQIKEEQLKTNQAGIILDNLQNNLTLNNLSGVVANLASLIKLGSLSKLLKHKNFAPIVRQYAEGRFRKNADELLNKTSPETLSVFLQLILIGQLKVELEKSAALGLYLANVLAKTGRKEFLPMVYGDVKSGIFKWREIVLENGQLKFQ